MSKDSLEQLFGIPLPAEVTQAGCDFIHEVIRRNRVYVQQVQAMAMYQGLIQAAVETANPSLRGALAKYVEERMPSIALAFNAASRARDLHDARDTVDNFMTYLCDLVGEVYQRRPEAMRSSATVTVADVLTHRTMEEFVEAEIERRVSQASRKGWSEMRRLLESDLKLTLSESSDQTEALERAVLVRNLVTHRRGRVDSVFLRRWDSAGGKHLAMEPGQELSADVAHQALNSREILMRVINLDQQARTKFHLPCVDPREGLPSFQLVVSNSLRDASVGHDPLCPCAACEAHPSDPAEG